MRAQQATQGIGWGRTLIGVVVLAVTLAYGSVNAAAGDASDAGLVTEAACAAGMLLASPSGDAWASTREYPGRPY